MFLFRTNYDPSAGIMSGNNEVANFQRKVFSGVRSDFKLVPKHVFEIRCSEKYTIHTPAPSVYLKLFFLAEKRFG